MSGALQQKSFPSNYAGCPTKKKRGTYTFGGQLDMWGCCAMGLEARLLAQQQQLPLVYKCRAGLVEISNTTY